MRNSGLSIVVSLAVAAIGCGPKAPPATTCPPVTQAAPDPTLREAGVGGQTITQLVTMKVKAEHEQDFLALTQQVVPKVYANEPGTLTYALVKHPTEERTYMWIERYRDAAALAEHGKQTYLQEAIQTVKPWLEDGQLVRYEQIRP
jgi:quinol monooxygenase YgiN